MVLTARPPTFGKGFVPQCRCEVAVHQGTIDSAPPAGDMLLQGGILRGHLNLWEVLYSHPPKVHCPDPVIVRTIPAFTAAEQMPLLLAVPLFRMSTDRAGLRRICRVNIDHMATETFSFVLQFLFQVIIRPADRYVSVFQKYALRRGADAGKVLQDEQRPLWVSADECLRQAVVDIAHPTVFSLPDGTDPSSGGGGLPGLEFPAELLIMRPFLFHNSPGCKGSPLSIKSGFIQILYRRTDSLLY